MIHPPPAMSSAPGPLPSAHAIARRVLILAPIAGDARAMVNVLRDAGFGSLICEDLACVALEIARDDFVGAGAVLAAQEAFTSGTDEQRQRLIAVLAGQPEWSDLPLVLLSGSAVGERGAWEIARRLDPVGNITILERPLRRTTLLNAVAVALRARERQYQLRLTLLELDRHRHNLEDQVTRRTQELAESMEKLRASERLASLGTLATGLGHDIANLTLPIRARLDVLRADASSDETREDFEAIDVALVHLNQLSAGMRLIGMDPDRAGASSFATDLSAWAAETTPMLRAALPRHVRLETHIAPGLGVRVARHRLAQVVFNLVQNAGEALSSQPRGDVRLTAAPTTDRAGNPAVRLVVSDSGPGMPPEVLARCFEPYFSTKGRAIATGMGLSMVKGIIEAASGHISVQAPPGGGTTFTMILPTETSLPTDTSVTTPARSAAISLANQRLAQLAALFLKQLGYDCCHHEPTNHPDTNIWVASDPDPALVADYLSANTDRWAIALTAETDNPAQASRLRGLAPPLLTRLILLPRSANPGQLRDAILRTRPAVSAAKSLGANP